MNRSRHVGLSIALILLVIAPAASAGQFSLRLYGGGNYLGGGDLNKGLQGWADYWVEFRNAQGFPVQSGAFNPIHLGFGAGGDLLFHFTPHFAVGIGTELVAASRSTVFAFQSSSSFIDWEYTGKMSAVPMKLSAFYFFPLSEKMKVGIHAGAGYYSANTRIDSFTSTFGGTTYLIEAKARGIGFHGGIALEMKISPRLSLFLEAAGRMATLSGFEGSVTPDGEEDSGWNGMLRYWEAKSSFISRYGYIDLTIMTPGGSSIFLVRDAKIDFSGASLRVGILIEI